MDNCFAVVKRISTHLSQYHHIDKKSHLFKTLVLVAKKRNKKQLALTDETDQSDMSSIEDEPLGTMQVNQSSPDLDAQSIDMASTDMAEMEDDAVASEIPDEIRHAALPTDFLQFQMWLQSADGGRKCEKSAKQHAFQVGVIFDAVAESRHVSALWDYKLLSGFLKVHAVEKQFSPATIKSYLSSVRHWFSYIVAEESDRLTSEEKQRIQQVSDRVLRWIGSYKKEAALRHLGKMDADLSKLITPEKVAVFDRSEPALSAIKIFGEMNDGTPKVVTQNEYTVTRDFLLTQIIITNANRSGVLANMTVKEFFSARLVDGNHVVSVVNHKTAFTYGPAKIVLNPSLFSWLTIFVKFIRSQCTRGSSPFLFLSWNGEHLESGQITRAAQSVWKKAGLGSEITCTLMRKSAVSSIHQSCPEEKERLADLMCHTTQTASKSYKLVQRQQTSVAASKVLTNLMKSSSAAGTSETLPAPVTSIEDKVKLVWTDELVAALQTVFVHEIKANSITLQAVKQKYHSHDLLAQLDPRKIYDKVRQICQRNAKAADSHLDTWNLSANSQSAANENFSVSLRELLGEVVGETAEESAEQNESPAVAAELSQEVSRMKEEDDDESDDCDIECPSSKSTKSLFSKSDQEIIRQSCKEIILSGPISQRRLAEALAGHPSLMAKFTIPQLISRVKYERRLKRMAIPKYFI